ncbi:MAG: LacI family DNA-binding transcriptional regulator [Phototrophicaceae bacterium]
MVKRSTIGDIARAAGVGHGTVSRVLNDHPYVSEETREKVLATIRDLGYRPSLTARQMRTQQSQVLGFLTDVVATTPYAGDIIRGAQDAVWEHDYSLLVMGVGHHTERLERAVDLLLQHEVDGIIYAAEYHQPVHLPKSIHDVPTVLVNCFDPDQQLPSIVPDEITGGYEATQVLIQAGHREIGFINVNNPYIPEGQFVPACVGRLEGFQKALQEADLIYNVDWVFIGDGTPNAGYQATQKLLQKSRRPTALFCGNDRTAMGAYDALREAGLKIPTDMAIVGFDNQEIIASALRPPLTSLQLPHYDMGRWGVNFLLNAQPPTDKPVQALHHCQLVLRQSV